MYAADAISPNLTNGEVAAIVEVVGAADADSCLDTWVGNSTAMMRILDFRLLSVKLGPESGEVPSHPLAFEDKEGLVVPWPVVEWILGVLANDFRRNASGLWRAMKAGLRRSAFPTRSEGGNSGIRTRSSGRESIATGRKRCGDG